MKAAQIVNTLLQENGGIISTADVIKAGISRMTVSQFVKDGRLERIAHGRYIQPDSFPDELYIMQMRSENIIFSHETALFLHGMAERTPAQHSLTIPSDRKLSPALSGGCKIYYIKPELHGIGKCTVPSKMGHMVNTYNAERTICDILRSRNRVDSQTLATAMKEYAARNAQDWKLLSEYAGVFRVTGLLRQYMEVLT